MPGPLQRSIVLLLALAGAARGDGLRVPEKLTVALSDELLGSLAPDGRRLYFVSNRNATSQIFTQDLEQPASTLLFDEGADATWPRPSPDGKHLLYLSFREDAGGALCVRELPSLARRCLPSDGGGGALEAEWRSPDEIVLLERGALADDLRVRSVRLAGHGLQASPLLSRNLTGLAVSPDGRWLAYVPLARGGGGRIGPAFAAQAARALAVRPWGEGGAERTIRFDLPGATGQPAFSPDGRWLYFTQYLNDTDQNGVLDGDDHGVVFRAPIAGDDVAEALARATPEQLTSAAWNCQYPAPSRERLIVTCARGGSLDLYALPPDGVVPAAWSAARVRDEADASRDPWEKLLLVMRLARSQRDPSARAALLLAATRINLGLGEYESAAVHAREVAASGSKELAPLGRSIELLVAERRALRAFDRGQIGHEYVEGARERLRAVEAEAAGGTAAQAALAHLVACELRDHAGDKEGALRALDEARAGASDPGAPAFVVAQLAERAEALGRELDRPELLLEVLRPLVDSPALGEPERLRFAGIYARTVARGLAPQGAEAARDKEMAQAPPGSARAFGLALDGCLDRVALATLAAGRACVGALYDANPTLPRRRALVAEVIRRAEDTDADDLEYELAKRWAKDVPRESAERRHAERLLHHVVVDYAYAALRAGRPAEAADDFEQVARETDSLEAHVGAIESSLAAGRASLDQIERDDEGRLRGDRPALRFVRAYLAVRKLADRDDAEFDRLVAEALADVREAERELPQKCEVRALHGEILHLELLRGLRRTGAHDLSIAEEANVQYLLALDLAHENPRYRAMVLEQLALLHAAVGNHRIAIGHFDERARLPFPDARVELGHHLLRARSLLHVGRDAEAAKAAEAALALVERTPSLARFRPLAIERAALYALSAGEPARAAALYEEAARTKEASTGEARDRNRVVFALAHAAAELSVGHPERALVDLDGVDRRLGPDAGENPEPRTDEAQARTWRALGWPELGPADVRATYDLLRLGLRGRAERALGRLDDANRTLSARRAILFRRLVRRDLDDDLLALSLAEAQLADLARARHALSEAAQLASQALEHADENARRTGTPLSDAQLAALSFAAELQVTAGAPASAFSVDVPARLRAAFDHLQASRDPARADVRRRLGVYLTLLALDAAK